jgi:choice-of-anchor B domain-containing protein
MHTRASRARSTALASLLLFASLLLPITLAAADEFTGARGGQVDARADESGYAFGGPTVARDPGPDPVRQADQLTPLGTLALPGYNADIWAHNGFAYIGTWGSAASYPTRCPATGVRIISLADPANPALVGAVATIAGTSQEDVVVKRVATPAFTGDLLATGIQACQGSSSAPRGVDLWDVTDPRNPQHLAFWASGPAGPAGARGVHELYLFQRDDRAFVAAAVPSSEDIEGVGDFRLVDVTDPRNPVQVSDWGARLDGGIRPAAGQSLFAHSAWTNAAGTLAVLSYWDAGVIFLDITDPAAPRLVGRAVYPAGSPGDTHSVWFTEDETTLLVADESFDTSQGGWGYLRLFDIRNLAAPVQIGEIATPNSASARRDGTYAIHNPFVVGDRAFLAWYSDGIRVVDIADPSEPREVASFVPPTAVDPYRSFPDTAQVWGVYVAGDLVLASDINAGLYVLRYQR